MFVVMIMIPTRLLPIQGLGNFGTHEAGWVFAFHLFGYGTGESILIAFNSHIVLLVYVITLGLYAVLTTRRKLGRKSDDPLHG